MTKGTTRIPVKKAVGERGSWFATVDGERLPCVHQYWIKGSHHKAMRVSQHSKKDIELVDAIKRGKRVIVTKDQVYGEGEAFDRTGYVAVFDVDNVNWTGGDLDFDLVQRVCDLK